MEFYQFHPTGIYRLGILLSEASRGDGGILLNGQGERFMERYAPNLKDLATRDVCSRSIYQESATDGASAARITSTSTSATSGAKVIEEKLPDIIDFARIYLGVDPIKEPMPIQPTAHYAMGGIPTDIRRPRHPRRRGRRSCPGCTRRASAPASASTAPTAWARTRSSTCSSSAGGPAARWRSTSRASGCRSSAATSRSRSGPRWARSRRTQAARTPPGSARSWPT